MTQTNTKAALLNLLELCSEVDDDMGWDGARGYLKRLTSFDEGLRTAAAELAKAPASSLRTVFETLLEACTTFRHKFYEPSDSATKKLVVNEEDEKAWNAACEKAAKALEPGEWKAPWAKVAGRPVWNMAGINVLDPRLTREEVEAAIDQHVKQVRARRNPDRDLKQPSAAAKREQFWGEVRKGYDGVKARGDSLDEMIRRDYGLDRGLSDDEVIQDWFASRDVHELAHAAALGLERPRADQNPADDPTHHILAQLSPREQDQQEALTMAVELEVAKRLEQRWFRLSVPEFQKRLVRFVAGTLKYRQQRSGTLDGIAARLAGDVRRYSAQQRTQHFADVVLQWMSETPEEELDAMPTKAEAREIAAAWNGRPS